MKTFKLFAYAVAAGLVLSMAACSNDDTNNNGEVIVRGDKACRIESFILKLGTDSLKGDVYDYDKSIDLAYKNTQQTAMKSASAIVTLSEGATISPDPTAVIDYTKPVSFTVTAKDGTTKRTYTTSPVEKVVKTYIKVSEAVAKTSTDMGVGNADTYKVIGTSGDKLVIGTKVFNAKTLAAVGDLNMTGYTDLKLSSMTNDGAGHLVGALTSDGGDETTPVTIVCWKDGYDKAATTVLGPSNSAIGSRISAGGDLTKGKGLITALGARTETGPHFCWEFTDGVRSAFYTILTNMPSNDGSWAQQVSPCSGDVKGTWFVWDAVAGGHDAFTWSNWDTTSALNLVEIPGPITEYGGPHNWGNYTLGSVRSFTFNDTACAAILTNGWAATYISIVNAKGEFLLNPSDARFGYGAAQVLGAYMYDEANNCGYVYVFVPGSDVKCWKLEVAEL